MTQLVQVEAVTERILSIRGKRVMLDSDLAMLYGVTTGNLNKAVKRNIDIAIKTIHGILNPPIPVKPIKKMGFGPPKKK